MAQTPIQLVRDRSANRQLPEVPWEVADAFGSKALVVLQHGRWTGLDPHQGEFRLVRLVGGERRVSASITSRTFGQLLDTDEHGRTLVIGGKGESLFAVEPDGTARCLGVMTDEGRFSSATWLADGGVAALLGDDLCIYAPSEEGPFVARARWVVGLEHARSIRRLPGLDVLVIASDDQLRVVALAPEDSPRELARLDGLEMVAVEFYLDETGNRVALLDGPVVFLGGDVGRLEGLDQALAARDGFPSLSAADSPAPLLARGEDRPPPSEPTPTSKPSAELQPDALLEPDANRLGSLTRAMIRMLRSATARTPDMEMLKLIRSGMPTEIRAYVHVWATHSPAAPAVDEFWLAAPRLVGKSYHRAVGSQALQLGILASGEPVFARFPNPGSCEVVMIDEEGVPYRYRGLEGFLQDLRMRAKEHGEGRFVLDAWTDDPVVP